MALARAPPGRSRDQAPYPLLDLLPTQDPPPVPTRRVAGCGRGAGHLGVTGQRGRPGGVAPSGVATSLPLGRRPGRLGGRVGASPGLPLPGGFARWESLRRVKEIPPGRAPRAGERKAVPAGTVPAGPSLGHLTCARASKEASGPGRWPRAHQCPGGPRGGYPVVIRQTNPWWISRLSL